MSEVVVLYQLSILVSVVGIGVVIGRKPMLGVAIAWGGWTIWMVFTGWLFVLQFGTIAVASFFGFAIQRSARYPAIQSSFRKALLWLGALAAVGIGVALYSEYTRVKPVYNSSGGGTSEQSMPNTVIVDDANLLAEAKGRVNQRYPALDPNAFNYSYYALTDVLARQQILVSQGTQPALAYETAADQIMAARQPRTYVAPQSLTESPQQPVQVQPCEYKAVMADSDYRACGLNPPQSRPLEPRPAPAAGEPEVYDKGNHPGFPPNCRWLSQSEFSCK
jgi:hypothetical protein